MQLAGLRSYSTRLSGSLYLLIVIATLVTERYYSHCTNEETEAQAAYMTHPRSQSFMWQNHIGSKPVRLASYQI